MWALLLRLEAALFGGCTLASCFFLHHLWGGGRSIRSHPGSAPPASGKPGRKKPGSFPDAAGSEDAVGGRSLPSDLSAQLTACRKKSPFYIFISSTVKRGSHETSSENYIILVTCLHQYLVHGKHLTHFTYSYLRPGRRHECLMKWVSQSPVAMPRVPRRAVPSDTGSHLRPNPACTPRDEKAARTQCKEVLCTSGLFLAILLLTLP